METNIITATIAGILLGYFALRVAGYFAFKRMVSLEQEKVLNSEEFKIKGRFEQ